MTSGIKLGLVVPNLSKISKFFDKCYLTLNFLSFFISSTTSLGQVALRSSTYKNACKFLPNVATIYSP